MKFLLIETYLVHIGHFVFDIKKKVEIILGKKWERIQNNMKLDLTSKKRCVGKGQKQITK